MIHDRYLSCLKAYSEYNFPAEPDRVQHLLHKLPEVQEAAGLLKVCILIYLLLFKNK